MNFLKKYPTSLIGDNHEFVLNKKSRKLIIFFTGTGAPKGYFNFYNERKKLDCNILFINNGENEWYQEGIPSLGTASFEETLLIIKQWIVYLKIYEVYTCGSSMGAYGAMLYGIHLNNSKILAFAPEIELMKIGGRTESHMKKGQKIQYDLINKLKESTSAITIYAGENDPIDIYHASLLNSFLDFPNIKVYSICDKGHNFAVYYRDKNLLSPLLKDFIDNKDMYPLEIRGKACDIDGFPEAYYWQYYYFKQKKYLESQKYGEEAISKYTTSSFAQYMLGIAYTQLNDLALGLTHLSIARSLAPTNLEYQFAVANCLRRMGNLEKAKYLHHKILQVNKDFAKSHYDLSIIYQKNGDMKGAIARAKYAHHIEPKNASFKKRVDKLAKIQEK